MDRQNLEFDIVQSIKDHAAQLRPKLLRSGIICAGEYLTRLLLKWNLLDEASDVLPVFIVRSSREMTEWTQSVVYAGNVVELDENAGTHFWFNIVPQKKGRDNLAKDLEDRSVHQLQKAIITSTTWDGFGSGLLPFLSSQFEEWGRDAVAMVLLPSEYQPSDAHFNAVSSVGLSLIRGTMPLLLLERDHLENYVGVDRRGITLQGNVTLHYILELMLSKETLVHELFDLSKVFGVKVYAVLLASGTSLDIYGSLKNILESALLNPLLAFDVSSSTVGYVLLRMSTQLRDRLSKETIEREISKWFKGKAKLNSLQISEPVYVEDRSDRIDVLMFVGGFDKTETFGSMLERSEETKNDAVARSLVDEGEWKEIVKHVTSRHH